MMDVLYPYCEFQAFQVSPNVWMVPCAMNVNDNSYVPFIRPFVAMHKAKPRHVWSKQEDVVLRLIVENRGPKAWNEIALEVNSVVYASTPVRQGKQCRERWYNHLDPSLRKGTWTLDEDIYILQLQRKIGNRWSEISKGLEGRTENSVKNHWKCMIKQVKRRNPDEPDLSQIILDEKLQLKAGGADMFSDLPSPSSYSSSYVSTSDDSAYTPRSAANDTFSSKAYYPESTPDSPTKLMPAESVHPQFYPLNFRLPKPET